MYKGYKVIDGDGHMYEPVDLWDRYVEPEYYDKRPIIDKVLGAGPPDLQEPRSTYQATSLPVPCGQRP